MALSPTSSARSSYSSSPVASSSKFSGLPIMGLRDRIVEKNQENHVTLIVGETGCAPGAPRRVLSLFMRDFLSLSLRVFLGQVPNCDLLTLFFLRLDPVTPLRITVLPIQLLLLLHADSTVHQIWRGAQNAWDMLHEEESCTCITTSCADLDNILGGGINCKEVTEIGGVPGIGKTQLGIQLAVNVQIPIAYGGLGGKAIYIDTEGSFMVERVSQIAEACLEDMLEYNSFQRRAFQDCPVKMQPKDFLENIFYFRVCSYTEQIAVINYLEKFISENKDVIKVVIIDSVTFHFRQDFEDMALRTRLLSGTALKLMKLAKRFSLAVVLLNQVTTKYSEGSFHLTLALGDSWSHSCTNRIILYWNGNERYAYIDKSPSLPTASAPYSITGKGIRNSASNSKRVKMM